MEQMKRSDKMNGIKINGVNYDWGDVVIANTLTGLNYSCVSIDYKKKQDKGLVYGLGNEPIGTGNGTVSYEGTITLKKPEVEKLNLAAKALGFNDILGLPGAAMNIVVVYMNGYDLATDVLVGVCFKELPNGVKQGDKTIDIALPFIYVRQE